MKNIQIVLIILISFVICIQSIQSNHNRNHRIHKKLHKNINPQKQDCKDKKSKPNWRSHEHIHSNDIQPCYEDEPIKQFNKIQINQHKHHHRYFQILKKKQLDDDNQDQDEEQSEQQQEEEQQQEDEECEEYFELNKDGECEEEEVKECEKTPLIYSPICQDDATNQQVLQIKNFGTYLLYYIDSNNLGKSEDIECEEGEEFDEENEECVNAEQEDDELENDELEEDEQDENQENNENDDESEVLGVDGDRQYNQQDNDDDDEDNSQEILDNDQEDNEEQEDNEDSDEVEDDKNHIQKTINSLEKIKQQNPNDLSKQYNKLIQLRIDLNDNQQLEEIEQENNQDSDEFQPRIMLEGEELEEEENNEEEEEEEDNNQDNGEEEENEEEVDKEEENEEQEEEEQEEDEEEENNCPQPKSINYLKAFEHKIELPHICQFFDGKKMNLEQKKQLMERAYAFQKIWIEVAEGEGAAENMQCLDSTQFGTFYKQMVEVLPEPYMAFEDVYQGSDAENKSEEIMKHILFQQDRGVEEEENDEEEEQIENDVEDEEQEQKENDIEDNEQEYIENDVEDETENQKQVNEPRKYISWLEFWVYMCRNGEKPSQKEYLNDYDGQKAMLNEIVKQRAKDREQKLANKIADQKAVEYAKTKAGIKDGTYDVEEDIVLQQEKKKLLLKNKVELYKEVDNEEDADLTMPKRIKIKSKRYRRAQRRRQF